MRWKKEAIVKELKSLHRAGQSLSYNAMTRKHQALVSAAAYHFGSYRSAVEKGGLDYADITRRPRWTRPGIIALIKQARRAEKNLSWSSVIKRRDELGRAAFASLQKRLFGGWDRALHAAGLHADEVSLYRQWDKATVAYELRERHLAGDSLSSGDLQKDDASLHAAAIRYFGEYDKALRAAKIDPRDVRKRRRRRKN